MFIFVVDIISANDSGKASEEDWLIFPLIIALDIF